MAIKVKSKKTTKKVIKTVAQNALPTDWADAVLDAAIGVVIDAGLDIILEDDKSQQQAPQTSQNSYASNYQIDQSTTNNYDQRVIQNIYQFPVNSKRPKIRNKSLKKRKIPSSNLSRIPDNQTNTATVGTSISIKDQSEDDRHTYGKLIFNPLTPQKKVIKRSKPSAKMLELFKEEQRKALDSLEKAKNGERYPIEHAGYLYIPLKIAGLSGRGEILYGMNSIIAYGKMLRNYSSQAFVEPSIDIEVEVERIDVEDDLSSFTFFGDITPMESNDLAVKLGYSPEQFKDKTIEEVFVEYGLRQYDLPQSVINKNKNAKNASEYTSSNKMGDNVPENLEQFVVSLLSSIFFRSGFHRFPSKVPESILFDPEKYGIPSAQPHIWLEDQTDWLEYIFQSIDDVSGQFPLEFKYQSLDDNGKKQEQIIKIDNIAECLTELAGMVLNTQNNSETLIPLALKNLVETVKGSNASIASSSAIDAVIEYLGFKTKEKELEVPLSFTPNSKNIKEALQDSKGKIVVTENVDKDTLEDAIQKLLIFTQITALASKIPFNGKDGFITGDSIREEKQKAQAVYEQKYNEMVNRINNKIGANAPKVKDRNTP